MLSYHSARARWMIGAFLLIALASTEGICHRATTAADKEDQSLSAFMRKKLDASSKILEGITTEDSQLVVQGADALLAMSKTEIWNVLLDQDYRDFNTEFLGSVRKLRDAAEKGNFDNATLQWMDAVKSCVECHKYVRSQRPVVKKSWSA